MKTIGVSDAKAHFGALLERVAKGESIMLTKHGVPMAKLVPISAGSARSARAVARLKALRGFLAGASVEELQRDRRFGSR